jgi:hypothetical protein
MYDPVFGQTQNNKVLTHHINRFILMKLKANLSFLIHKLAGHTIKKLQLLLTYSHPGRYRTIITSVSYFAVM